MTQHLILRARGWQSDHRGPQPARVCQVLVTRLGYLIVKIRRVNGNARSSRPLKVRQEEVLREATPREVELGHPI